MSEYMSACDCIITKAGPGTIAEALICGLPILLNGAHGLSAKGLKKRGFM
jgi:UDP-N-acetylglucosamine:LPS N-acetylglucosamine transferase